MPDVVGVTATRHGANGVQLAGLEMLLGVLSAKELHHGCAVGGDGQAAEIANRKGLTVVGHPSTLKDLTSARAVELSRRLLPPLPPLERNVVIVRSVRQLIVMPRLMLEEVRSGTWHTYRAAQKYGVCTTILWPDGSAVTSLEVGA